MAVTWLFLVAILVEDLFDHRFRARLGELEMLWYIFVQLGKSKLDPFVIQRFQGTNFVQVLLESPVVGRDKRPVVAKKTTQLGNHMCDHFKLSRRSRSNQRFR